MYYAQAQMMRAQSSILTYCPDRGNDINQIKTIRIMKKIFFPIVMMASLLVAGCAKENLIEPEAPQQDAPGQTGVTELSAAVELPSKTVLQNDTKVLWTNGDAINVNGTQSAALELEEPVGEATFTFKTVLTPPYKAVFPASIYKDATTVTLPAYQTYKEGTFSATASPMAAFSETSSLKFNHLCSVLKLTVNLPADSEHKVIEYVDFYGKNNEQVSGDFTIDFDALSLSGASTAEADRKLRYKVSKNLGEEPFVMYIVVPAQEYANGYTIRLVDDKGHFMEQSKKSGETLVDGKIYDMPAFDFVPTGTELGVEIASAEDLVKFAEDFNAGTIAQTDLKVVTLAQDIVFDAETSAAYAATGGIGVRSGDNAHYFGWVFNGNNKTIKSYTANVPLFAAVDSDGIVKDLVIDETSVFTFDANNLTEMATVVGYHKGLMENVTVNADIKFADAEVTSARQIGGICARIREGKVQASVYTGHIHVPAGFSASGAKIYFGGIVGWISNADGVVTDTDFKGSIDFEGHVASTDKSNPFLMLGGIVGNNSGTISDCEVFGDKKFNTAIGDYSYDTATLANRSTLAYFCAEGGVAGVNAEGGKIQNCINRANFINFILTTGADGTAKDANSRYLFDGGIVGYNDKGVVEGCTNYGFIFNRSTPRIQKLGGIAGRNTGAVSDCINETTGTISVGTSGSTPYSARLPYVGGVIGENASANVSNVQNKAKLVISRTENTDNAEIRIGGVIGANSAAIDGTSDKNISNSGDVVVESNNANVTLGFFEGGVVGWTSASVKNVKNTGTVSHKHSVSLQKLYLSGIVGAVVSGQDVEISGCRNEGEVYFNAATASASGSVEYTNNFVGGILAHSTSNVAISLCENTGYVHGGNTTTLNQKTLYVGGIVGYLKGKSSITSCINSGIIRNAQGNNSQDKSISVFAGGVAGFVEGTQENLISISKCHNTCTTDINHRRGYAGGIAGYAEYATLTECSNVTNFNSSCYYIGGIVGWLVNATVTNCDWTGTSIVSSQLQSAGGIVAKLGAGSIVDGCDSYLETLAKGGAIAGISEVGSTIKNCHYKAGLSLGICSDTNFTGENNKADL